MELAIGTLILIILGIMVLVGLVSMLVANWDRLSETIKGYVGSEQQTAIDICETQCTLGSNYDFCCSTKTVDGLEKSCADLNVACNEIDCNGVICS